MILESKIFRCYNTLQLQGVLGRNTVFWYLAAGFESVLPG